MDFKISDLCTWAARQYPDRGQCIRRSQRLKKSGWFDKSYTHVRTHPHTHTVFSNLSFKMSFLKVDIFLYLFLTDNESDRLWSGLSPHDHATFHLTFLSQKGFFWIKSVSLKAFMSCHTSLHKRPLSRLSFAPFFFFFAHIIVVFTVHQLEKATISKCLISLDMLCL